MFRALLSEFFMEGLFPSPNKPHEHISVLGICMLPITIKGKSPGEMSRQSPF
jgi:hypothetical protein